jgi:valyl-tRNA synthetase
MPPPNATGDLHLGHALFLTLQDIMIRYKRMRGFATLWLPGTDHAAIATQYVVEKQIQKAEGKSRHDIGREELLRRIGEFVEGSRGNIRGQIRAMGSSCDWSREAFTLDEKRNVAVRKIFKDMYDAGIIYRGYRIINWDPKGQTTVSDDEIEHEERQAKLYTFKYSKDFPIAISTTRPETKVGDTAVAVHPNDARYAHLVGKTFNAVFCDVPIEVKIIADEEVDPAFGTGALGVTPAHSSIDWDMSVRHNLPQKQVINEYAKMMVEGRLNGLKVEQAREEVVKWLESEGLLEKTEDITQNVSISDRFKAIIEPLPKLQWFVDVNKKIASRHNKSLRELMREKVDSSQIQFIPEYYSKVYNNWLDKLHDWCISRQIWYGHRVPVWYRGEEVRVGDAPTPADGEGWVQDEDSLDTWFSSGAWTFTTLGWPEKTSDLARFHPTDVLETGHDILFFWIARMILMTSFALDTIPFKTIYMHGLVLDAKGKKFSKSAGNGIDPLDMIAKYGTDALRLSLIVGNTPGTNLKLSEDKIKAYKLFSNKLWNIARFIIENTPELDLAIQLHADDLTLITDCATLVRDVTRDMEEYRYHVAIEKLYNYTWNTLASVILEESKEIFKSDAARAHSRKVALRQLLDMVLKTLHPFAPFVTEEIWTTLYPSKLLMIENWPDAS